MTTTTTALTQDIRDNRRITQDNLASRPRNPFATRDDDAISSASTSSTGVKRQPGQTMYFRSRRIKKSEIQKPWLETKDPRQKWVTIIPLLGLLGGVIIAAILIYDKVRTVQIHAYCPVLMEDFSAPLNPNVWTKEVEVGGFGNGQFEETTNTDENAFIQDGQLWLKPTLQDPALIESDNVRDLLQAGTCTGNSWFQCVAVTNTTNSTIVNPVKSARLNTKKGATIRYGRVEVEAQLPSGDWLWPAIWLLPVNETYGPWPGSGEIDIVESRGNNYTYLLGGDELVTSTLHWGPDSDNDGSWRTSKTLAAPHTTYADGFHTFGMEWSEKYLFTYVDNRLRQVSYVDFSESFWRRGNFPPSTANGTRLVDPWSQTGRASTPFDQDFYLILNVAVGGTNGWFKDGESSKPWVDASPTAKTDFWNAQNQWYPTWKEGSQMKVKSVKMWQQKGYNGC